MTIFCAKDPESKSKFDPDCRVEYVAITASHLFDKSLHSLIDAVSLTQYIAQHPAGALQHQ